MKTQKPLHLRIPALLQCLCCALLAGCSSFSALETTAAPPHAAWQGTQTYATVEAFAQVHNLGMDAWPESLLVLLDGNPDAESYVLNYPLRKDAQYTIDLSEYENCTAVPAFYQWDERWGYSTYNENLMGLSGCGPTCLSMVCVYVLGDTSMTPRYVADFSEANGYCSPGSGSHWSLFSEGGAKLGLEVIEIPLDEDRIIRNLEVDNPIVCSMGPGDFTTGGHYIVMVGYEDGKIRVNDPNSPTRTSQLWEYEDIKDQIRNLWVCR